MYSAASMYNVQFPGLGIDVSVNPVAFTIGSFEIRWYGIIIAVGFLLAFLYALRMTKAMNIDADRFVDVVIVGIIGGIIGARLYYVLYYPGTKYIDDPLSILYIWEGGLAIYGGIIGSLICAVIMAKIRKLKIPAVLDLAALGFLIGQCIGRWANFMNQEAFGAETDLPWRMFSENTIVNGKAVAVHPCFLYESLWCLIGFVLLHFFTKKLRNYDGQTFLLYLVWYGFGRFFIEGLRTDSLIVFGTIRVSQLVAAATVVVSLAFLIFFAVRKKTSLSGCGSKKVMALCANGGVAPIEEPAEAPEDNSFTTIFGDLGYDPEEEAEEPSEEPTEEPSEEPAEEPAEKPEEKSENKEEE